MIKRDELVILFVILLAVFSISVQAFFVDFVSPTPANYASNTSITINVSSNVVENSYAFVDWNNTLSLWLTMDTNSSGGIYDRSRYSNNCSLVSSANVSQGYWGNASNYDGVDDYANCGDPANGALDVATEDFSISFWVKPIAAGANGRIIVKGATAASNAPGYLINFVAPNVVSLSISNASTRLAGPSSTTALTLGNWHHVVLVADRDGTAQFYLNGTTSGTAGSIAAYSQSLASASALAIGSQAGLVPFNGSVDDVVFIKRAISSSEVLALYNYTRNKYTIDFASQLISAGDNYNYTAYIVNSSGGTNNSETRQFTFAKSITLVSPQYTNRNYTSITSLNLTTNFDASCKYSNDSGVSNYSLSSTNNRNFNATVSLAQANYVVDFYCNDSSETVSSQSVFSIVDHLVWYVDNSSATCSDTNNRNYATSRSTPFCTILEAMKNVSAGDEVVILNSSHSYCEPINTQGISGTAGSPIIVRGESDSQRTILNGTCSATADAIELDGEDFYTFRYFYITNFSYDALNIHASGSDNSLNITFENMTVYQSGYSGRGVVGGAYGDGVSFHENCTGVGRWINFTGNWKSGILDINGAQTDYYNLFITDSEDYGVYFLASGYSNTIGKHYLESIIVRNSSNYCLASDVNVTAKDYTCVGNTGNHQFYFGAPFVNITNFNISQTSASYNSTYIYGMSDVYLTNGKMDGGVFITNSSRLTALNVSYDGERVNSSTVIRMWYYDLSVLSGGAALEGANVSIINESNGAVLYSEITDATGNITTQNLISYTNNETVTFYNYTVNVSKAGYVSSSAQFNLTSNLNQTISLSAVAEAAAAEETETLDNGGSTIISLNEEELKNGANRIVYLNGKAKFKVRNENHELKINRIFNDSATITVSSVPQTATLSVGEEKKFSLNDSEIYDLSVRLNSIKYNYVNITLKEINEQVAPQNPDKPEETEPEQIENPAPNKPFSNYFLIFLAVVVLLIVVFVIFRVRFGKRRLPKKPNFHHLKR